MCQIFELIKIPRESPPLTLTPHISLEIFILSAKYLPQIILYCWYFVRLIDPEWCEYVDFMADLQKRLFTDKNGYDELCFLSSWCFYLRVSVGTQPFMKVTWRLLFKSLVLYHCFHAFRNRVRVILGVGTFAPILWLVNSLATCECKAFSFNSGSSVSPGKCFSFSEDLDWLVGNMIWFLCLYWIGDQKAVADCTGWQTLS